MHIRPGTEMITPAVKNVILANVAVFLIQMLWPQLVDIRIFGLVPYLVLDQFFIWQLVTYMFLHGGFSHILFNMFAVWMFGSDLERTWGTKEFLRYYFLTGTLAGVSIFLWNFGSLVPTIGASGAVFGILAAYALFFPNQDIYIWGIFPVKAKFLALFFGLIELLMLPNQDGVSHIGHLGGMVAGYFYLRHRYRDWGIGQIFFRDFFKKKDLY